MGWGSVDLPALEPLDWIQKGIGLLLSTVAISLGAPFWFDMLQKLANIRAVGRNPKERAAAT